MYDTETVIVYPCRAFARPVSARNPLFRNRPRPLLFRFSILFPDGCRMSVRQRLQHGEDRV